jgi:DGQHR domain-containing protein
VNRVLERKALRVNQNDNVPLYLFALAAGEISDVADLARVSRDEFGKLIGYQRPEKKQHVRQILDYLDSADVLFPNALIIALPPTVRFRSSRGPGATDGLTTSGSIEIPLPSSPDEPRPGWIVDGQQRSLALARTRRTDLAIPIAAFIADDVAIQRDQFLRVNTVSPLPANLVTELLPEVWTPLPPRLSARKLPSALVDMLNLDPESPFVGLIRRASTPAEKRTTAVVTDNSLVLALEESLNSPSGVLFPYRNLASGTTDTTGIRHVLFTYWSGVRDAFPEAWGKPPTASRLMHGVGIRSMGRLMDRVMANVDVNARSAHAAVRRELARIEPVCRWTEGEWDELHLPWNDLQNTPRHISTLSNYLVRAYLRARSES